MTKFQRKGGVVVEDERANERREGGCRRIKKRRCGDSFAKSTTRRSGKDRRQ